MVLLCAKHFASPTFVSIILECNAPQSTAPVRLRRLARHVVWFGTICRLAWRTLPGHCLGKAFVSVILYIGRRGGVGCPNKTDLKIENQRRESVG